MGIKILKCERYPTRQSALVETFNGQQCYVCGETEAKYLTWWPHHNKIKYYFMRYGKKTVQRHFAKELIGASNPICVNCIIDKDYGEEKGLWP